MSADWSVDANGIKHLQCDVNLCWANWMERIHQLFGVFRDQVVNER